VVNTADSDSFPEPEGKGSRSNILELPHPAAALENEKDMFGNVDNDEMNAPDSQKSEYTTTKKATSVAAKLSQ
jgi:hypothetical protein